jgi:hypothetical protein
VLDLKYYILGPNEGLERATHSRRFFGSSQRCSLWAAVQAGRELPEDAELFNPSAVRYGNVRAKAL